MLHRGGAVGVERGHENALAVAVFQAFGELGGGGGFTRALQADHQDGGGRVVDFQLARIAVAGQNVDQFIVDDLDDLLARRDGFCDGLAGGLFLHGLDEIAGNGERDVGFQKGDAHFAKGGFDVVFGERTLFGQPVENTGEAF